MDAARGPGAAIVATICVARKIEVVLPTLTVVIPHWPLDEETNESLRRCVASFPTDCERLVIVNEGTGYGRNVNIGLRLATGDYIAVVNNDCRLAGGNVYELCVAETVTSPLVIGERQGLGESIEPGGFHGAFWVIPAPVLERVGLLDESFEWAYFEDDDLVARLRQAGVPTKQIASVQVKHLGALTTLKIPDHRKWLDVNASRYQAKWGSLPPPVPRYRKEKGTEAWHFCQNCPNWPSANYEVAAPINEYGLDTRPLPPGGVECVECQSLRDRHECAFY